MNSLSALWQKGSEFLGVPYPILAGAMTWVSERNLVSAISNAGGFGVLACGAMSPDMLRQEIQATKAMTHKPFGVNLITMHPDLKMLADVCIEEGVAHVVLAGGLPKIDIIQQLKSASVQVICFAPALVLAKKLVRMGADALVLEGMEAGGHTGPVATSVLVQEIIPHVKSVPVFVAGGIGRGEVIATYLKLGAAGCQLGSRFVCAHECRAHSNFKQAFLRAHARDAILSIQLDEKFPVIPVRALRNKATQDFVEKQRNVLARHQAGEISQEEGQLEIEHYWAGALRRAVIDGDIEKGSLMAGQSVGMVNKEQAAKEIIKELVEQASAAL